VIVVLWPAARVNEPDRTTWLLALVTLYVVPGGKEIVPLFVSVNVAVPMVEHVPLPLRTTAGVLVAVGVLVLVGVNVLV
jgi:hypothetical protein